MRIRFVTWIKDADLLAGCARENANLNGLADVDLHPIGVDHILEFRTAFTQQTLRVSEIRILRQRLDVGELLSHLENCVLKLGYVLTVKKYQAIRTWISASSGLGISCP